MIYIFLLCGLLLGFFVLEEEGIIFGLLFGLLGHYVFALRKEVQTVTGKMERLQRQLSSTLSNQLAHQIASEISTPKSPEDKAAPEVSPPVLPKDEAASKVSTPGHAPESIEDIPLVREETILHEEAKAETTEDAPTKPEESFTHTPQPVSIKPASEPALYTTFSEFLKGRNWLAWTGVVLVFFAVSLLVRLAIENNWVPIELRFAGVGALGATMVALGSRLVGQRREYGLTLEGGGIAVLYLTVFASYRLYSLVSDIAAGVMLIAVTVLGITIALRQQAQWVAVLSLLGGFFVPVVIASDEGSHVALFSYYVLLNAGILAIGFFRSWPYLNVTGFICTFAVGTVWGGLHYRAELFASTEPFLVAFFLIYLALAVIHGLRHRASIRHVVDATLVFGLPVVVFTLQGFLVESMANGLAISAAVMGLCYLGVSYGLRNYSVPASSLLTTSFTGIGVALLSLFIPLMLDSIWAGMGWAIEGAALVWLGFRQQRRLLRWGGHLLVVGATLLFLYGGIDEVFWSETLRGTFMPLANVLWISGVVISGSMLCVAYLVMKYRHQAEFLEQLVGQAFMIAGLVFWFVMGIEEISREITNLTTRENMLIVFGGFTTGIIALLSWRLNWQALAPWSLFQIPFLLIVMFVDVRLLGDHSLSWNVGGLFAWPFAVAAGYGALYVVEKVTSTLKTGFFHACYVWIFTGFVVFQVIRVFEHVTESNTLWSLVGFFAVVSMLAWLLTRAIRRASGWPFTSHATVYLRLAVPVMMVIMGLVSIAASFENEVDISLYIPLLNPLDIVLVWSVLVGLFWFNTLEAIAPYKRREKIKGMAWSLVGTIFIWVNATIARTVHHWGGVFYDLDTMLASSAFQTAISICWTSIAVLGMVYATRRGLRTPWIVAACLLGVVVIKLFAVDLSNLTPVLRIVSFMGVGVLLLVVGYIAPVPPRLVQKEEAQDVAA